MGPTGERYRVLQIHPTRRCNLRCLHCYSSSGPEAAEILPLGLLHGALADSAAEGYNVAGISGGEPLLYRPLRELLEGARRLGMLTTVTSNGMLLNPRRLDALDGVVDLLAISLDGVPESHNRTRASPRAFDLMAARLESVRASGIPFGFIFTLTRQNVHELEWAAGFALEQGARLLQIHPLEPVGRAQAELPGEAPDEFESAYAYVLAARLQREIGNRLYVQLDLSHRRVLQAHPQSMFAGDVDVTGCLSQILSPLVIEPDGTVVPLQYGFARHFALGNLRQAPLRELVPVWRRERYEAFQRLCREAFAESVAEEAPLLANWYDTIGRRAAVVGAGASG